MKIQKNYNFEQAQKLENYVRMRYKNQLSNGALQFYLLALPYLEQKRCGLYGPVTASYRQLAEAGFRSVPMIKTVLNELKNVLCEVEIGAPINGGKQATTIRRFSLKELQTTKLRRELIITSPDHANQLAKILNNQSFIYGDSSCKPFWNVSKTGRVLSSKPNVQGDPEKVRVEKLRAGLEENEILFSIDFKQAEPAIIRHLIGQFFSEPPYERLQAVTGMDRQEAKRKVNILSYCKSAVSIVEHWDTIARCEFIGYAKALDKHKEKLWQSGAPRGKKPRHVFTLGGSRIQADRGNPPHKGSILNWCVQGTVADIVNPACLDIANRDDWKLIFPVHDSVFVIGRAGHGK